MSLAEFYQTCGIPKCRPRVVDKLLKDRAEDTAIAKCYAKVDLRDGRRCQFPGCRKRMDVHHHVIYRSRADRAVKHTTVNVVSLCREHERWIHGGLVKAWGNANRGLKWALTKLGRDAKIRIPDRTMGR